MKKILISIAYLSFLFLTACNSSGEKTTEEKNPTETSKTEGKNKETEKNTDEQDKSEVPTKPSEEGLKIAKKWLMVKIMHNDKKEEDVKAKKGVLELKTDGTFVETFNDKEIATGNWKLEGNDLVVKHLTGEFKGKEEKLVVKEKSDTKLVTVDNDGKMTETYEVMK
jgi:major membrane immunogen (membrane-anchored lipoprotein)